MRLTRHGMTRQRQRGFSELALRILEQYGRQEYAPGGATKLPFGCQEAAKAAREFQTGSSAFGQSEGLNYGHCQWPYCNRLSQDITYQNPYHIE